ncbi:hypothetical protein Q0Q56_14235, partial [Staphylococcus aureus]|nr:hypothetical protein [Staphylococcus aureus]
TKWTFKAPTTKEIATVTIDPKGVFPDINPANNVWSATSANASAVAVKVADYTGVFSSQQPAIKMTMKDDKGALTFQLPGQEAYPL